MRGEVREGGSRRKAGGCTEQRSYLPSTSRGSSCLGGPPPQDHLPTISLGPVFQPLPTCPFCAFFISNK
jgi:hypothetical protein